ncbi:BRCT domain-containing protein [Vibrio cyclitrophicus]|uniref:BRCT domain-containing protein n=1 Tax=Vibrio cyclitrophicus TaxID=47951 RepID=UPI0007EE9FA0|nr:BRCT domain-containing protein [Vibrio cyclitrophicus]OBT04983.1 DNA ligase [Vibrio cyclitrophicus]PMI44652.1 DNA ligase [Vibrio cyclitrophicus]
MTEFEFNNDQLSIINELGVEPDLNKLEAAIRDNAFYELSNEEQLLFLVVANACYRSGFPVINDPQYDEFSKKFAENNPEHSFVTSVESEVMSLGKTVSLPQKMLSTDKAYSKEEIQKWLERIIKAANALDIDTKDINIRVTPKLDGYAAFDDGERLYTRGDGVKGQDVSRAFDRGLEVAKGGDRGLGAGEIVIDKTYFEEKLSQYFENSRNIQAAIIAEKNVDSRVQQAINDGACFFYPFSLIDNWTGHYKELMASFENIIDKIWNAVGYDVDGVVLEATDPRIKEYMGATRKFHRWQIAFKINEEAAEVEVLSVTPQTSRTGRVSPVAELVPTKISGATISRVTVHHYNMVKANGVGKGAVVQIVRSGLVIPKIEKVIKQVEPQIPTNCPSCKSHLIWESDHLICPNKSDCPAQTENTLIHFFKILGNNDGFGPKVIEKLSNYGIKHIHDIYGLKAHQFAGYGFGDKTSKNLFDQLQASREVEVEDWRFLSAFGVSRLGGGNCEKLLQHHSITELFELSADNIVKIDGFARLSAEAIVEGLANIKDEFFKVYELGFNLSITPKESEKKDSTSPISGAVIVFTGTMLQAKRSDMEKQAKYLGAKVGKSVTSKTTYLVAGTKVGETKINGAREKGVEVLSEQEYLDLIN